jgi:hypothetical protein
VQEPPDAKKSWSVGKKVFIVQKTISVGQACQHIDAQRY